MTTDPNGNVLFEGVVPITEEFLAKQGHRWPQVCPDYSAGGLFQGQSLGMVLGQPGHTVPVQVLVCRCGAIIPVPLGPS